MSATDTAVPPRSQRQELLERLEDITEWPLLFLALVIIPILGIPLFTDVGAATEDAFETTFWIIWAVFVTDLSVRLFLTNEKPAYLVSHWYDVLAVTAPALELVLHGLTILRSARLVRLLRLLRLLPFAVRATASARRVLKRRGLQYILLAGLAIVFGAAGLVMAFEDGDGTIDDYGTALWWAATTITTVGYGDQVPTTPEGKGIAVALMFVGIAFFSWITANVAAFLVEFGGGEEDGVTTQDLMRKLETMESEIRMLRAEQLGVKAAEDASEAFRD